jgi:death-on-curing protein
VNSSPHFLSVDDILILHALAIADQGGEPSVRDRGLLESAVAMPAQQIGGQFLHHDVPAMAVAYAYHVCQNHPFVDGNKRAAVAAMIAFLSDNGWSFDATADQAEAIVLQLASGAINKAVFSSSTRRFMREKPKMELRDFFARLKYEDIAQFLKAGMVHDVPELAHKERFDTMMEAAKSIPAIHEATLGASGAERSGNETSAMILRSQAHLLTAIYRIAQDMGYEW